MSRAVDLTGSRFGSLTVLARADNNAQGSAQSLVRCECGNQKIVKNADLKRGSTVSCGCRRAHRLPLMNMKHGAAKRGERRPEYGIWAGIIQRCTNPNLERYVDYGGRGITVCPRWTSSFEAFLLDVGARPSSIHSIDRIDPNGNYEPGNVRWATPIEQRHNRRDGRAA